MHAMQGWVDDDELEAEERRKRRKDLRRAVLGGVAGVTMLVAPIVLANAVVPAGASSDVEADGEVASSAINALRGQSEASQADAARASAAASIRTTTTTTTTEPPSPITTVPDSGGSAPDPYSYATWDQLAECESGGNWSINTGNGYYGGLQFSLSTWQGLGGTGLPSDHSREEQIAMGIRLYESSSWAAWPACTRELGWR